MTYIPILNNSGDTIKSELLPFMPMGEISTSDNAVVTVITTQSSGTLFDETTILSSLGHEFDQPQNGRLRYIGEFTKNFHCGCTISIAGAGTNDIMRAYLVKNGTVNGNNEFTSGEILIAGQVERKLGGAGDAGSTAIHVFAQLATNDYLELAVANDSASANLTLVNMNMFAVGKQ